MKVQVNKGNKGDFVDAFMNTYMSPGIKRPLIDFVYKNKFEIIELNHSYQVIIKGETKRFRTLCYAAEFIFDRCFNPAHVYVPPPTVKQLERMRTYRPSLYAKLSDKLKRPLEMLLQSHAA